MNLASLLLSECLSETSEVWRIAYL